MTATAMVSCAWCDKPLREGVGHGICTTCAASLVGEWVLPPQEDGIDARWVSAFVATRLQDVLARFFLGTAYPRLSVEDRALISVEVERFLEEMRVKLA